MEFLIKKAFTLSAIIILLNKPQRVLSQNFKTNSLAFDNSYNNEKFRNFQSAINDIKAIVQPDFYEANLRLGWLYSLIEKYDISIQFYQQAAKIKPASIEPLLGMARVFTTMGQTEKVEVAYHNTLHIDAKNYTANYGLGVLYHYKKDFTKAKKYLDVGLNLLPFDYGFLVMSAWNYYYLGMYNEARILFQKTLLVAPNDKWALQGLGMIK